MNGPKHPLITIKGKGRIQRPKPTTTPQALTKAPTPPKPKGPSYTPPRAPVPHLAVFWLVMKDSGRRPKVRRQTLEEARTEAQRIAAACPGAHVWVIEARTVETHQAPEVIP